MTVNKELIDILLQKVNGEVDYDWAEIAQMYEVDVSVDSLRKYARGIQWCDEAGVLSFSNPIACVIESATPEGDERMAAIQARDLRREVNELYRAEARADALRRAIIDAADRMPPMIVRTPAKCYWLNESDMKLVVPIADCHYGAEWEIKGLKGEIINRYSPEIFEERMGVLLREIVETAREEGVEKILLLMAGDSLDGMLRQSQLMRLRYGVVDATMRFAEFMSQWIDKLTSYGLHVELYNVMGNHTEIRPLGSKRGDFPEENLEKIITWYMAERLSHNGFVKIHQNCQKHHLIDVLGSNVVLGHGDDEKDIVKFARDMMLLYQTPVHYFYAGHKHTGESYTGGTTADGNTEIIRVPSMCGVDTYANSLRFGGRAGTELALFMKDEGIVKKYPIWFNKRVGDISEEAKAA